LRCHPQSIAGPSAASRDDQRRIQHSRDDASLDLGLLVRWIPGDHTEPVHRRQLVQDFLANAAAEIRQVAALTVIRERQHGDGVVIDECGADGALCRRARSAAREHRRVAAFRQVDDQVVRRAFGLVVAEQPGPESPRLDADDRVGSRVEGRLLVEHLNADDVFLQFIAAAGERLEDDEIEEPFEAIDLVERRAPEHLFELATDLIRIGRRCRCAPRRHAPILR
jgi:hypothetical protein